MHMSSRVMCSRTICSCGLSESLEVDVGVCGVRPGKTEAKRLDQALQGRPCLQKVQMSGTAAGLEAGERLEPTALDGAHTRC